MILFFSVGDIRLGGSSTCVQSQRGRSTHTSIAQTWAAVAAVDDVLLGELQRCGNDGWRRVLRRAAAQHPVLPTAAQDAASPRLPCFDCPGFLKELAALLESSLMIGEGEGALLVVLPRRTTAAPASRAPRRAQASTTSKPKLKALRHARLLIVVAGSPRRSRTRCGGSTFSEHDHHLVCSS